MGEIDFQLRRDVSRLQDMVVGLNESIDMVGTHVAAVGQEQKETRNDLMGLRHDFLEFVKQAERTANVQRAETRIGVLQDQIEHTYGHHKVVRNTAIGMLQAFDLGLVSEESVRAIGDQLMVQTPRYWLAPVLVALSAWAENERELCDRAIEEAFRRSPSKTSLFMALVLRRQERQASSVRWLRHYLNAQDPTALGRDFAVILESISQGAFGPAGVELMQETLARWQERLLDDESVQDAQVARWRVEVEAHVAGSASARYPRLAGISPQWPQMDWVLSRAGAHQQLIDEYTAMMAEEHAPSGRLEDAVDDILDRLVTNPDDEELPLRRELAFNEAVLQHGGDMQATRQTADADAAAYESTLDYLTIQTTSALNPSAIGVSRPTQRVAVASCHEWFARAHAAFTKEYRMALPARVDAVFGSAHNHGAQAFQLPEWVGSFDKPMEQLEQSLAEHWDRHGQSYIDRFAFDWKLRAALGGAATVFVLIMLSMCAGVTAGLVLSALGGGIFALVTYQQYQSAVRKQQEARDFIAQAKHDSITQLRATGAELIDWSTQFREMDGLEERVREMVSDLASAGHVATPYERRAVSFRETDGA